MFVFSKCLTDTDYSGQKMPCCILLKKKKNKHSSGGARL